MVDTFGDRFRHGIRGLTPGYFALVMASGILSVGFELEGYDVLSMILLVICAVAYVVLVVLTAYRFIAFRAQVKADFADPRRAFGFFTLIAGTDVLGTRLAAAGWFEVTAVLLVIGGSGWLVLGYVIPWTAVLGRSERPVVATANGTWFIWVVASQSVAIAASSLETEFTGARDWLALIAVTSWSVGIFLYAAAGILVALRLMLYDFGPEELNPPYWVAMGAAAITVLSAARIVEMADAPMVNVTRELIAGVGVVFWAFATWLIPVLVAAGVWRHWVRKVPLTYEATLWSIIFPLGMYGVAGLYLGEADQLPIVEDIGRAELWVALAAWAVVLAAMIRHLWSTVIRPRPLAAEPG